MFAMKSHNHTMYRRYAFAFVAPLESAVGKMQLDVEL
jgi:hypothetical protein